MKSKIYFCSTHLWKASWKLYHPDHFLLSLRRK